MRAMELDEERRPGSLATALRAAVVVLVAIGSITGGSVTVHVDTIAFGGRVDPTNPTTEPRAGACPTWIPAGD